MIVDLYNPTITRNIHKLKWEPSGSDLVCSMADFAHSVQWVRENDENDDLDIQLDSSELFACIHACVGACMYMHVCMLLFYSCFSLSCLYRLVLSLSLRVWENALEEAVKLELGLPYLFAEICPMRLASGWRGTLWHVSFPHLHGTFSLNCSIFIVVNLVKQSQLKCWISDTIISVGAQFHIQGEKKFNQ